MEQNKPLGRRERKRLEQQKNKPKITFQEYVDNIAKMPDMNNFKLQEKTYKVNSTVETDFSDCLDFKRSDIDLQKFGCKKLDNPKYEIYELEFPQGVFVIKNYLSIESQLTIAKNCMNKYINEPYRTNLFIYDEEKKQWKENGQAKENPYEDKESEENKSEISQNEAKEYNKDTFIVNDFSKYNFNTKIRWSNVGSQYDWDNRSYPSVQTPFPEEIKQLSKNCQELFKDRIPQVDQYEPEAIIINFYYTKSYMTGHLDDGETEQVAPIFSFSLGTSCVFLQGDREKDFKPIPIILEAGDLMVMSGYSRNCYHGVPRVIQGSFKKEKYIEYLKEHKPELFQDREKRNGEKDFQNDELHVLNFFEDDIRINLNFRQVLTKQKEQK